MSSSAGEEGVASALAGKGMQNVVTVNDYLVRRDGGGGGGGTTSYTTLCVKVPSDFQLDYSDNYSDSEAFFFSTVRIPPSLTEVLPAGTVVRLLVPTSSPRGSGRLL